MKQAAKPLSFSASKRFRLRDIRGIEADLRRMQKIRSEVRWLLNRESNCGKPASLLDAIDLLIHAAFVDHRKELIDAKVDYGKFLMRHKAQQLRSSAAKELRS